MKNDLMNRMEEYLQKLSFRDREIIKMRYGIGTGYTYSRTEIARIFKVTVGKIRYRECKAINKLNSIDGFAELCEELENPPTPGGSGRPGTR